MGLYSYLGYSFTGAKEAQYAYINTLPDGSLEYYFMQIPANGVFDINLGYKHKFDKYAVDISVSCANILDNKHIEYTVFDSSRVYFGLDTPARNLTEEQKRAFENRNALNGRRAFLRLQFSF